MNLKVWGLTGGIGSGKSEAARIFSESGIPVLDADKVAQELRDHDPVIRDALLKQFGTLDRAELKKKIFSDPRAKKNLESILHPRIREESLKQMEKMAVKGKPIIYEAALLIEAGRLKDFAGLIVITAPEAERIKRIALRDGIPQDAAKRIISSQLSEKEFIQNASHVIVNDGDLYSLRNKIQGLIPKL